MLDEKFVILAIILILVGGGSYFIDTVKGITKPNKITWFIWTLAPLIAFVAELKQGVGMQSLMTFIVGFIPLIIFLASFINKEAYWKIAKFDIICGSLSIIGLVLWKITTDGNLAILFSILADGLASIATIVKSYSAPETENYKVYLFVGISAVITMLTIDNWNFQHYAFPLYIFIIDLILFIIIRFKIGIVIKKFKS